MKVVFRVDASNRMGTGHLTRCRTLAEVLRGRGAEVRFICREHPGDLIETLSADTFPVVRLPAPPASEATGEEYALWLGVSQELDAAQSIAALNGERADWLVVDHYGLSRAWELAVRPHVTRILALDDLANRPHDCDLLLDQNFSSDGQNRYSRLVPESCRPLLGPRYALLRPEYAAKRCELIRAAPEIRRVLVFFGGSDPANVTEKTLRGLSASELAHLSVDVVIGPNNHNLAALERLAAARPRTQLHPPQPHLADLIGQADLCIGAGGTTTWERMCLGVPTLIVSIADNQRPACRALHDAGVIHYAGHATDITDDQLRRQLIEFVTHADRLGQFRDRGLTLVDGLGALRVAESMSPAPANRLSLRPARNSDVTDYFVWANDPITRQQAFNETPILWDPHCEWFFGKLRDSNCRLFVFEAQGLPVGQIRFDFKENGAYIDYSLDILVRGRGWGSKLVALGVEALHAERRIPVLAEVKASNNASCKVFWKLRFDLRSSQNGIRTYVLPPDGAAAASTEIHGGR